MGGGGWTPPSGYATVTKSDRETALWVISHNNVKYNSSPSYTMCLRGHIPDIKPQIPVPLPQHHSTQQLDLPFYIILNLAMRVAFSM